MQKGHLSVSLDQDLIEFAKSYALNISVSEIFSQFILNRKRRYNIVFFML